MTGISCSAIVNGILEHGDAAETDGETDDSILDLQDTPEGETPICLPPLRVCGFLCTDTRTDRLNCGDCGIACESPSFCEESVCVCPSGVAGWLDCEGQCVNTMTDPSNCGGCGTTCGSMQVCDGTGKCSGSCAEGFETCTDAFGGLYCADTASDLFNCGGCGRACEVYPHMSTLCSEGSCIDTCEDLWFDVDSLAENGCECYFYGEEVCDGVDDDCNGTADDGYDCVGGSVQSCMLPESACSGLRTCDSASCIWSECSGDSWTCNSPGAEMACVSPEGCPGGAQVCQNNCTWSDCTGAWECTTPGVSGISCTVSGKSCPGTRTCTAGCTLTECLEACAADCCVSGCTDLMTDRNNCGDCNNRCESFETCISGSCTELDTSEDVVDDAPDTPDVPDIPDIPDFPDEYGVPDFDVP